MGELKMVDVALNKKILKLISKLQNDLTADEARVIANVLYTATERIKAMEGLI